MRSICLDIDRLLTLSLEEPLCDKAGNPVAQAKREIGMNVEHFASELKMAPELLIAQMQAAGVTVQVPTDTVTDQDKNRLLDYLRGKHGAKGPKTKITLTRKSTSEVKTADSAGRTRTVQVEVRKKRVLVKKENKSDQNCEPTSSEEDSSWLCEVCDSPLDESRNECPVCGYKMIRYLTEPSDMQRKTDESDLMSARTTWLALQEAEQTPPPQPHKVDEDDSFLKLWQESIEKQELIDGEAITAEIVNVDKDFIVVNAGLAYEIKLPAIEFSNDEGLLSVDVGDFVCLIVKVCDDGSISLSRADAIDRLAELDHQAKEDAEWQRLQERVNTLEIRANHGDVEALFALALAWEECGEFRFNYKDYWSLARECYFRASVLDHPIAQFHYGDMLESGIGGNMNLAEAVDWYRKSAKQGYEQAKQRLEELEELEELHEPLDAPKTAPPQVQAPSKTQPESPSVAAGPDAVDPIKSLFVAAENGDVKAQYELATNYLKGIGGVAEDPILAAYWFRQAAEQGYADAQNMLGQCYSLGRGLAKNTIDARRWYQKAADQGLAVAQWNCYQAYGAREEARKWLVAAAGQGCEPAINRFLESIKSDAEILQAERLHDEQKIHFKNNFILRIWHGLFVRGGKPASQYKLGRMLLRCRGYELVASNDAKQLLSLAANQGHAGAAFCLGYCADTKIDFNCSDLTNWRKAKWLKLSVEKGSPDAEFAQAIMLLGCYGVAPNPEEAVRLFSAAAKQGYAEANYVLGCLYACGVVVSKDSAKAIGLFKYAMELSPKSKILRDKIEEFKRLL